MDVCFSPIGPVMLITLFGFIIDAAIGRIGAQVGYRSFDLGYVVQDDTGSFELRGLYFGVVARY